MALPDGPSRPITLPEGLSMRVATLDDVEAILDLRRSAGWAAHEWALRLAIAPPTARCFVVEDREGEVVGVGSGVVYGALGFVGNMIVAERHQRRGVGTAVLVAILDFLEASGCTRVELFATEQGRSLYARHGFDFIQPGSKATLPHELSVRAAAGIDVTDADTRWLDRIAAFDSPRFGGDRTALLEAALADADRPTLVAVRGADVVGFGWLRVDDARIGPWVAEDPEAAEAILAEAFRRAPEHAALTTNIPMSNLPGVEWLRSLGVEPDPWDGRMARGAPIPRREETIYSNAIGALG